MEECLPSVVRSAERSRYACDVTVIDNGSRDDSLTWLAERWPSVTVVSRPNRGLASFNDVIPALPGRVAILLNNDIALDDECIERLAAPIVEGGARDCFFTAPRCWLFDGKTLEGFKTAVRWRWGLVQATGRFAEADSVAEVPGETASAGAALAVDREKFAALGGFDPLYWPGRLEDLDLCYRAFQAGWPGRYVPEARCYHRGAASFGPALGAAGCHRLALRNTLLFQWKNLRHPAHWARLLGSLPLRLAYDWCLAPYRARADRFAFTRALAEALARLPQALGSRWRRPADPTRERAFFARYRPQRLLEGG